MIIKAMTAGAFKANNYLLIDEESKKAVLIDASGDFDTVKETLDKYGAKLEYILNTHGHVDNISGNYEIQTKLGAKALLHKEDMPLVEIFEKQIVLFCLH
jgi:glyoxylase-like metal-dependent hydrolase (beta-lactamase superfamily II)